MKLIICGYSLGLRRLLLTSALRSPRAARRAVRTQVALVCLLAGSLSAAPPNTPGRQPPRHPPEISGRRAAAEYRKRAYPLGFLPPGARARALAQTRQADALFPKAYGSW